MDPDFTLLLSAEQRIHERCEEFIGAWRDYLAAGSVGPGPPDLRQRLGETEGLERRALFRELLDIDLHRRWKSGGKPGRQMYERLFPEFQDTIARAFQIGRYEITDLLGSGAFGSVYRALDTKLERDVAVKVPHASRVKKPEDVEDYLREAQILASLDHPNIVPVFDYGQTDDGRCYVVSKLIEGSSLRERMAEGRPNFDETAALIVTVAEALHYAHGKRLVHRDIKPGNILIDTAGIPFITDFGLAIRDVDLGHASLQGGTPAYMSPEQARGEGHRVDPRSDIFSLGVVLYELLTGKRPFTGSSPQDVMQQIGSAEFDAWLPSGFATDVPPELERICLKCLAKQAANRYPHAKALADDLCHFLKQASVGDEAATRGLFPGAEQTHDTLQGTRASALTSLSGKLPPPRIVPKGLRAFDQDDADFFLELLPGPLHPRDGLPESIHFWKTRIEETDPGKVFSVGLIYGPSGCGKSSLVKAGLLPRLAPSVLPFFLEANAEDTEVRLLHGLRRTCPGIPPDVNLVEAFAALRRGHSIPSGSKVLIVLDQFEQWLSANPSLGNADLLLALRQCDGKNVQCIVTIRDDFWMATTRFMRELETALIQGKNEAAVDLFDPRHARKVLVKFGVAYGCLPDSLGTLSKDQEAFLDRAVGGLVEDDKVIPVKLALLADMIKGKQWVPSTLKGGFEHVGEIFLEEAFGDSAPPQFRLHHVAARAVLQALLPESGANIKGCRQSLAQLLEISGYGQRPKYFTELIQILDSETRLITPTEAEGQVADDQDALEGDAGRKYYQLTHDYMVPSLRRWLESKLEATRVGRAELKLARRAQTWKLTQENRLLPSTMECLQFTVSTRHPLWDTTQRRMMTEAYRRLAWKSASYLALIVAAVALFIWLRPTPYSKFANMFNARDTRIAALDRVEMDNDQMINKVIAIAEKEQDAVVLASTLGHLRNSPTAIGGQPNGLHESLANLSKHHLRQELSKGGGGDLNVIRECIMTLEIVAPPTDVVETIFDVLDGDNRSLLTGQMLDYFESLQPSEFDVEFFRWLIGTIEQEIDAEPPSEIVTRGVILIDRVPQELLAQWLLDLAGEDLKVVGDKWLRPYVRATNSLRVERLGDFFEQRLAEKVHFRDDGTLSWRWSAELEMLLQCVAETTVLQAKQRPMAFRIIRGMVIQWCETKDNCEDMMDTVIRSFLALHLSHTQGVDAPEQVLNALCEIAQHAAGPDVAKAAIEALGKLGGDSSKVQSTLANVFRDKARPDITRETALRILVQLSTEEDSAAQASGEAVESVAAARSLIMEYIDAEDGQLRGKAIEQLARVCSPEDIKVHFGRLLADERVNSYAVTAVRIAMSERPPAITASIINNLLPLMATGSLALPFGPELILTEFRKQDTENRTFPQAVVATMLFAKLAVEHEDDDVRRLASLCLQSISQTFDVPAPPPPSVDADRSVQQEQLQLWEDWRERVTQEAEPPDNQGR